MNQEQVMVAYCRVSTGKAEQLESLEKQKEYFEGYANDRGYKLFNIYADKGISGVQTKNRTEFNRMMRDARQDKFDILAVKDITRFSRNTVDFLEAFRELKSLGIKVIFTNNNLGSSDPEYVIAMLAALGQEESSKMSDRIKFGKQIKRKEIVPNILSLI